MAYIPPHMRQSKGGASSSPPPSPESPPESVIPHFQRKLRVSSKGNRQDFLYAAQAISKWFIVGLIDESRVSELTRLEPVAAESVERKTGEKPLALALKENVEAANEVSADPWISVAETVKQDLISSFQHLKDEISGYEFPEIKLALVLRFGRVLFHGDRFNTAESVKRSSPPVGTLKTWRKSFYTDLPTSYVEYITREVVPCIDFVLEENEQYHIKLSDNTQPGSIISCKCAVAKDTNQLELFKIELNQVRHLVEDMSCPDKNLDLRLMLCTKRIVAALTDEELVNIKRLINSAKLDSEIKGWIKMAPGKTVFRRSIHCDWSLAYKD